MFHWMRTTLDRIESAHYDCFPSGHVELTVLAWWSSRQISNGSAGHISCTLFALFLLQFTFDTTTRWTWWRER